MIANVIKIENGVTGTGAAAAVKSTNQPVFVNRHRHHLWLPPPSLVTGLRPSVQDWNTKSRRVTSKTGNLDCSSQKYVIADNAPPFCDLSGFFSVLQCVSVSIIYTAVRV